MRLTQIFQCVYYNKKILMKALAILVTFLLVQFLSASFINEHATSQPVLTHIFPGKYVISDSTVKGTKGTQVSFSKKDVSFYRGCNSHWTTYKIERGVFSVSKNWFATYKGCQHVQHLLDGAVVGLFNKADRFKSTDASKVIFYHGTKWLFTITRIKRKQ